MVACAPSEELRDELIVSLDHCSWWEAPQVQMTGLDPQGNPTEQRQPNGRERAMQLTPTQVKRTLAQFEAQEVPADHSAMAQLTRLFGEHTFFLDRHGLNILEPVDAETSDARMCKVVCVADWNDADPPSLEPHEPEPTELVIQLESKH
jgi:hypothetical protein